MHTHSLYRFAYFSAIAWLAYCIKHWYSSANMEEMQWMMKPLALILDQFIPGQFERNIHGEWVNATWNIILVKACSGLNFFLLSFVALSLAFENKLASTRTLQLSSRCKYLLIALFMAWPITLLANVLRIIIAMLCIRHPDFLEWTNLSDESIHRLIGLTIYFPLLFLQLQFSKSLSIDTAYIICAFLITGLLIIVPLLTGNAFNNIQLFIANTLWTIGTIFSFGILLAAYKIKIKPKTLQAV